MHEIVSKMLFLCADLEPLSSDKNNSGKDGFIASAIPGVRNYTPA